MLGPAPVKLLGEVNALVWDESGECSFWRGLKATKPEVLEACSDLKVLNKTELRKLLAWRGKAAQPRGQTDGQTGPREGTRAPLHTRPCSYPSQPRGALHTQHETMLTPDVGVSEL